MKRVLFLAFLLAVAPLELRAQEYGLPVHDHSATGKGGSALNPATVTTTGAVSVGTNETVSGTLGVTGNTSLSTVSTSGAATLNSAAVTNNATVGGTLGVTGASTLGTTNTGTLGSGLFSATVGSGVAIYGVRSSGGDKLRITPNAANTGATIDTVNSAESDYGGALGLFGNGVTLNARSGVGTTAQVANFTNGATSLTGTLSATGLFTTTAAGNNLFASAGTASASGSYLRYGNAFFGQESSTGGAVATGGVANGAVLGTYGSVPVQLFVANAEVARLTGTGLGVLKTPSVALDVSGAGAVSGAFTSGGALTVSSGGAAITGNVGITSGSVSATGGKFFIQDSGADMLVGNQSAGNVLIYRSGAQVAQINNTGAAFSTSTGGAPNTLSIVNSSNTASSDSRVVVQTGGTSGGDAYIGFYDGTSLRSIGFKPNNGTMYFGGNGPTGGPNWLTLNATDLGQQGTAGLNFTQDNRSGGNGGSTIRILGWNTTNKNWQIDVARSGGAGLVFTPSTAAGGGSFTTPVITFTEAGGINASAGSAGNPSFAGGSSNNAGVYFSGTSAFISANASNAFGSTGSVTTIYCNGGATCATADSTGVDIKTTQAVGDKTTKGASTSFVSSFHQQITASLGSNVALNNTTLFFDGPSVAQGSSGTWFASGTVTVNGGTAGSQFVCKLWDGTTVIAATQANPTVTAGSYLPISLSGYISAPAGNLRISCKDLINTTGAIVFNQTGTSKDSTISAFKVAN